MGVDSPILEKPTRRRFLGSIAEAEAEDWFFAPIFRRLGFRRSGKLREAGKAVCVSVYIARVCMYIRIFANDYYSQSLLVRCT